MRDTGKAIYWLQDNPHDATDCDWHKARRYVIGLNKGRFSGYSDWRIPRRDEVESLLDFARWNAASDMAALLKKLGFNGIEGAVYWTSSPIIDDVSGDGIWGVNFATREYIRLGRSTSFSANVLPVRGRGWGSSEPELSLYEPTDKEGEGELIAARYHRCKAGNCALVAQKPRSLSDLGDRSERIAGRGQIYGNLKTNSGPIGRKFPGIWTVLLFSQQIHS
ncbi:DUF1566 domain-containing protein [Geotalea toluenoxydans]|uniref:Lcl C-terminal domain-containing protein n=1 Tax=Geotalea toluenoxydans TaxID=421624 RepID=UPI0006D247D0|nr:DUF1566 domain-containing protein [Geotalea toluenoxydans]